MPGRQPVPGRARFMDAQSPPGGTPPRGDIRTPPGEPTGRIRLMDAQRVNLDGFAEPDPSLGLIAMSAPSDPAPSLVITDGPVPELDSRPEADFASIN